MSNKRNREGQQHQGFTKKTKTRKSLKTKKAKRKQGGGVLGFMQALPLLIENKAVPKAPPPCGSGRRNWLDLPPDIMSLVLMKLGFMEILLTAQHVCSLWRQLAKEPRIFRSVAIIDPYNYNLSRYGQKFIIFLKEGLDRSCGQLTEFSSNGMTTSTSLRCVAAKSMNSVTSLRFEGTNGSCGLEKHAKRFPLLEELQVLEIAASERMIKNVGRFCPNLKYLRLRFSELASTIVGYPVNAEAFAIAKYMPQLHCLHLSGCTMTNKGLLAILNRCPRLEYVHLRNCFNVKGDYFRDYSRIKNVRLWDESMHNYEFDLTSSSDTSLCIENKYKTIRWN